MPTNTGVQSCCNKMPTNTGEQSCCNEMLFLYAFTLVEIKKYIRIL
jgi:hypothetical protein